MNLKAISYGVFTTSLAVAGATTHTTVFAQDIFVHPASCVAPFLYQAERMRWHEHFLMNPADGVPTWIVCPINYHNDYVTESGQFLIEVIGRPMAGADPEQLKCFFTTHSIANAKWGDYIDGTRYTFTKPLTTTDLGGEMYRASASVTLREIASALGDAFQYLAHMSVYCKLGPGWGINSVTLLDTEAAG